jgi:hypothetical protein
MDTTDSPVPTTAPVLKPKKRKFRWLKITYSVFIHGLALIALGLLGVALAVKMKWTNDGGNVDLNSRYFSEMAGKYNQGFQMDSLTFATQERLMYQNVGLLAKYYPHNAKIILDAFQRSGDVTIALRMLDAANLRMKKHKGYQRELQRLEEHSKDASLSIYPWANYREWKEFCKVVRADSAAIDSVSRITGVESRLIVMCLVGEQIRMFNSSREQFKKYVVPYNRLILTTNRGYGVTGILQNTALKIERNLYDPSSPFYPGDYYQNCLNLKDSFPELVNDTIEAHKHLTIQRLMKGGDHFYSYLYTAFFLRQFQSHWEKEGFTLAYRPEILGTLYNLGFQKSKPKKDPSVGGSTFNVGDKEYTFGGLCYEFYYSGELMNLFPLTSRPFIPTKELKRTIVFPEPEEVEEVVPPVVEG